MGEEVCHQRLIIGGLAPWRLSFATEAVCTANLIPIDCLTNLPRREQGKGAYFDFQAFLSKYAQVIYPIPTESLLNSVLLYAFLRFNNILEFNKN